MGVDFHQIKVQKGSKTKQKSSYKSHTHAWYPEITDNIIPLKGVEIDAPKGRNNALSRQDPISVELVLECRSINSNQII